MNSILARWLLVLSVICLGNGSSSVRAEAQLAKVFGDHMVLQRDVPIPVWGWADPDEEVVVTLGEQTRQTRADVYGEWGVKFGKLSATDDPLTLVVQGKSPLTLKEILVGEVWPQKWRKYHDEGSSL